MNRADDRDGEAFTIYTMNKIVFTPDLGKMHSFQGLLALTTSDKRSTNFRMTGGNTASTYLKDPSIPSPFDGSVLSDFHYDPSAGAFGGCYGKYPI